MTTSEWIDALTAIATATAVLIAVLALRTSMRAAEHTAEAAKATAKSTQETARAADATETAAKATVASAQETARAADATVTAADATAKSADATARAAEATEQLLAAETLPLLVDVPRGEPLPEPRPVWARYGEREVKSRGEVIYELYATWGGLCLVPFQNIGTGVARVTRVTLTADTGFGKRQVASARPDDPWVYVRPGEDGYVKAFTNSSEERQWMKHAIDEQDGGRPVLLVWFEDFPGVKRFELEAHIGRAPTDPPVWRVISCQLVNRTEPPTD